MNEIRIKLRSEKGASISFALLIFLVCAVTGSVILAAATAAAGRLSRLVESDQRYYSVTSAAEMLRSHLDGKTVHVERTEISETTKTYDYTDKEIGSSNNPKDPEIITIDGQVIDNSYKPDSILANAAYIMMDQSSSTEFPEFQIEASGDGKTSNPALKVLVDVTLDKEDGTISLVLKSGDGKSRGNNGNASGGDVYSLKMVLQADETQKTDVRTETGTPKEVDSNSYQIITKQTKITTTDYTWKLTGIETIMSGS